jgi:hypothetical protein
MTIKLGLKYSIKSTTQIPKQQKVNHSGPGPTGSDRVWIRVSKVLIDRVRVQKILDPMGSSPHGPFNIFSVIYVIFFLVQSALCYLEGLSLKRFVNLSLPIVIRLLFDICLLDLLQLHRTSFIIILYHDNYLRFSFREKKLCLKLLRFFEYKKSNSFNTFSDKKNDY